jgi:hypothetical protein
MSETAMIAEDTGVGWPAMTHRDALLLIGLLSINLWGLIVWGMHHIF